MLLGRVIGTLVPSIVIKDLESVPMLIIQPLTESLESSGSPLVAADSTRMAAAQELIYYEGGREAALALEKWFVPVDHTIIGIVDDIHYLEVE